MTKRDAQAAEYAAEQREKYRVAGEWLREQFFHDGRLIQQAEHDERIREERRKEIERFREEWNQMWRGIQRVPVRIYRRDTLGIRVHRAVSKWLRVVWLKFLGR